MSAVDNFNINIFCISTMAKREGYCLNFFVLFIQLILSLQICYCALKVCNTLQC